MKRKLVINLHIAVWSVMLFSDILFAYLREHASTDHAYGVLSFAKIVIIQTGYLTIPVFCFYFAYYFVAPHLFVTRKYFKAILLFLLTVGGAVILRYSLEYFFFLPVLGFDNYRGHPWPASDFIENVFWYYFPKYFIYGLMYFFAENWYKTQAITARTSKGKVDG